jgi:hypothetical protein
MMLRLLPLVGVCTLALAIARSHRITPPATTTRAGAVRATIDDDGLDSVLVGLERQSWVAWKARDGAYFQNFLSEDHVETGSSGLAGKSDVVGFVGSKICVVERYSLDRFRLTRFDANTALLSYHATQSTTCNGVKVPSPVWVSSLFLRRDGKWLNALYQQTPASK